MNLTSDQIQHLAPDAQVLAAGQRLGNPLQWQEPGRHDTAVWGECRGSALYKVAIDTAAMAYPCSCPSRKRPCKHVVGLLALSIEHDSVLRDAAPPEWVAAWLTRRETRAHRGEVSPAADAVARPRDPSQQERRADQQRSHILDGIDALELWMCDLVRNGLATVEGQAPAFWQHQAAWLVDAGAPGLASWVRRLSTIPDSSTQWPERLLGELGRIELLIEAYRRIDQLDPLLQHDVQVQMGRRLTKDEVSAAGEHVTDEWVMLGEVVEEDEQLRVQLTRACWLNPAVDRLTCTASGTGPSSSHSPSGRRKPAHDRRSARHGVARHVARAGPSGPYRHRDRSSSGLDFRGRSRARGAAAGVAGRG